MYRSSPPNNEGWEKVEFLEREKIRLKGGEIVDLYPFYLTKKALSLGQDQLAKELFNVPLGDLYVRKIGEEWMARVGDRFLCSHRHFLPSRVYGYYENELLYHIAMSDINVPLGEGLTGDVSEEAVKKWFFRNEQNKTVDSMSAVAPIESP